MWSLLSVIIHCNLASTKPNSTRWFPRCVMISKYRGFPSWPSLDSSSGGRRDSNWDVADFFESFMLSLILLIIMKENSKQSIFSQSCSSLENKKEGKRSTGLNLRPLNISYISDVNRDETSSFCFSITPFLL